MLPTVRGRDEPPTFRRLRPLPPASPRVSNFRTARDAYFHLTSLGVVILLIDTIDVVAQLCPTKFAIAVNMSVTTTANPIHYNLEATLADYDLHHSGEQTEGLDTSLNAHPAPNSSSTQSQQNPSDWPTEHRRVPAYRPINHELDQSERRVYLNGIEQAFVGVMFTGVFLESVSL